MATIWDNVVFDPCQRPAYTKYEISKMVADKRSASKLSVEDFSKKYGVSPQIIEYIEKAERSFSVPMYRTSGMILGLSMDELLKIDHEDLGCVKYRAEEEEEDVIDTVNLANIIFNEAVIQKKLSAR